MLNGIPSKVQAAFRLLLVMIPVVCVTGEAQAGTVNAVSCSSSDVQAAINSTTDGDTVAVPTGSCTWSTNVTIPNTRGITLQGAGIDQTTIIDSIPGNHTLTVLVNTGNSLTRVTGFTFNANNVTKTSELAEISVGNNANVSNGQNSFRIDHVKITNVNSRGILVWQRGNDVTGVIDHWEVDCPNNVTCQGIAIEGAGPQDGSPFSRPLTPGTSHAVYIEDGTCNFSYPNDSCYDAYTGARYVFRHNTVIGTQMSHHGADSGSGRGVASFEIYSNTSTTSFNVSRIMFFRSGVGIVFDNTAKTSGNGYYSDRIVVNNYRSCNSYPYWNKCDGTSQWDENQSGMQGYGCLDQVGHFFTQNPGGSNAVEPLYAWNNTLNGSVINVTKDSPSNSCSTFQNVHMIENREFYNYAANFNGGIGMGSGPLASRPTSCTPITGYFATDTSTLYKCSSANTWTVYYTPYTYPHPLQSSDGNPPQPPTDLNAIVH